MGMDRQLPGSGRLIDGKAMPYDFAIFEVLKQAWAQVKGFKATNWGAYLLCVLPIFLLSLFDKHPFGFLLRLIGIILSFPLLVGYLLLGIKRAAGLPTQAISVFDYLKYTPRILGVLFLQMIMIGIPTFVGLLLIATTMKINTVASLIIGLAGIGFTLFGIYLFISYIFALPLTVEKKLGIWTALEVSRHAVSQHWFKMAAVFMLTQLFVMLSAIPLGIGLIWTLPMKNIVYGILYRTQFGVENFS